MQYKNIQTHRKGPKWYCMFVLVTVSVSCCVLLSDGQPQVEQQSTFTFCWLWWNRPASPSETHGRHSSTLTYLMNYTTITPNLFLFFSSFDMLSYKKFNKYVLLEVLEICHWWFVPIFTISSNETFFMSRSNLFKVKESSETAFTTSWDNETLQWILTNVIYFGVSSS